jgi:hypothetical protein
MKRMLPLTSTSCIRKQSPKLPSQSKARLYKVRKTIEPKRAKEGLTDLGRQYKYKDIFFNFEEDANTLLFTFFLNKKSNIKIKAGPRRIPPRFAFGFEFLAWRKHFPNECQALFSGRCCCRTFICFRLPSFSALARKRHDTHGKICAGGPAAQLDFLPL